MYMAEFKFEFIFKYIIIFIDYFVGNKNVVFPFSYIMFLKFRFSLAKVFLNDHLTESLRMTG